MIVAGKTNQMDTENAMTEAQQTDEDRSKDLFFKELAELAQRMINAHGKEFSMGALVLAARFIAEDKSFNRAKQSG